VGRVGGWVGGLACVELHLHCRETHSVSSWPAVTHLPVHLPSRHVHEQATFSCLLQRTIDPRRCWAAP
jgi:hypothetical protein